MTGVGNSAGKLLKIFRFSKDGNAGCNVLVSRIRLGRRSGLLTVVARVAVLSAYRGTMLALAAYIRDIEGFMAPATWLRGAWTGKS